MKRFKKPGNAAQRKAIKKLATSGDIRGALELLQQVDPEARSMYIQLATGNNLKYSK